MKPIGLLRLVGLKQVLCDEKRGDEYEFRILSVARLSLLIPILFEYLCLKAT